LHHAVAQHGISIDYVMAPRLYGPGDDIPEGYLSLPTSLNVVAAMEFQFTDVATKIQNPVAIRLAVVSREIPGTGVVMPMNRMVFRMDILYTHCVNVSRVCFDLNGRVISFPTEPMILDSFLDRRFYCDLRSEAAYLGDTLGTVSKYQSRGFAFVGFADVEYGRFFHVPANAVMTGNP
jgi:hypothetical protein